MEFVVRRESNVFDVRRRNQHVAGVTANRQEERGERDLQRDPDFQEELSEGYTLTCVAYPTTDFSLETGESP